MVYMRLTAAGRAVIVRQVPRHEVSVRYYPATRCASIR